MGASPSRRADSISAPLRRLSGSRVPNGIIPGSSVSGVSLTPHVGISRGCTNNSLQTGSQYTSCAATTVRLSVCTETLRNEACRALSAPSKGEAEGATCTLVSPDQGGGVRCRSCLSACLCLLFHALPVCLPCSLRFSRTNCWFLLAH